MNTANAADTEDWSSFQVKDRRSGYTYARVETRAIQDDDFDNPGYIWVENGAELWATQDGSKGKSCMDCHDDAAASMRSVGATYPVYLPQSKN